MTMSLFADINVNWYLLPLVVAVSLVYGATRYENWYLILRHAFLWTIYILAFLAATYLVLYMVSAELSPVWYVPVAIATLFAFFWSGRKKQHPANPDS
jgi:hypothetical protein